jgi:hypothetical protein
MWWHQLSGWSPSSALNCVIHAIRLLLYGCFRTLPAASACLELHLMPSCSWLVAGCLGHGQRVASGSDARHEWPHCCTARTYCHTAAGGRGTRVHLLPPSALRWGKASDNRVIRGVMWQLSALDWWLSTKKICSLRGSGVDGGQEMLRGLAAQRVVCRGIIVAAVVAVLQTSRT